MTNKHIELVKKWLADPESVSQEELEANRDSALEAHNSNVQDELMYAYYAADAASWGDYASRWAAYWVKKYEELTNEK